MCVSGVGEETERNREGETERERDFEGLTACNTQFMMRS